MTDIKGSTEAIAQGRYKEVNSISTASVVAVLNVFRPLGIPYVFGGDGATLCIPPSRQAEVMGALAASRQLADKSFGLTLRAGIIPLKDILTTGRQILVGKYQPSDYFQQAMFQGNGLGYAEELLKDESDDNPYLLPEHTEANGNFEGFECRWNEVPSTHDETVAIMIRVLEQDSPNSAKEIYQQIANKIIEIYGNEDNHHPLQLENLSLTLSPTKLSNEVRVRSSEQNRFKKIRYLFNLIALVLAGKILMARKIQSEGTDWGQYKNRLKANTDYRKFDEILRMVLSGTREQRQTLTQYLTALFEKRQIVFGIHASPGALVTCLISDYDKNHVHFLDGSNGGYAMAAQSMKAQLKELIVLEP